MKNKYSIKYSPINNTNYSLLFNKKHLKKFNISEINIHNKKSDAWVVVDNYILDVTKFIDNHPGGPELFNNRLGTDISDIWHKYHHNNIMKDWFDNLLIGILK
jgi:cytochrome b involved in lipid metabolism